MDFFTMAEMVKTFIITPKSKIEIIIPVAFSDVVFILQNGNFMHYNLIIKEVIH